MKNIFAALLALIILVSCNKKTAEPPKEMQQSHPPMGESTVSSAAGVRWSIPSSWTAGPARQMRVATYNIPAEKGDHEDAECGVFYFGTGQGGDVEMNIDRWVNQFENAGKPGRSSKEVNGMKVELVNIAGTYLAPSGPMMQSSGKKENYRLLGAIISAPAGSVFFKLTGPAKTVVAAENDFNSLVESITQQ